jgi:hypothetical protein
MSMSVTRCKLRERSPDCRQWLSCKSQVSLLEDGMDRPAELTRRPS